MILVIIKKTYPRIRNKESVRRLISDLPRTRYARRIKLTTVHWKVRWVSERKIFQVLRSLKYPVALLKTGHISTEMKRMASCTTLICDSIPYLRNEAINPAIAITNISDIANRGTNTLVYLFNAIISF